MMPGLLLVFPAMAFGPSSFAVLIVGLLVQGHLIARRFDPGGFPVDISLDSRCVALCISQDRRRYQSVQLVHLFDQTYENYYTNALQSTFFLFAWIASCGWVVPP
jgi:hypothetical protein